MAMRRSVDPPEGRKRETQDSEPLLVLRHFLRADERLFISASDYPLGWFHNLYSFVMILLFPDDDSDTT